VARKVNFDYEKRQKDLRKQKKRQEKLDAKRARKEAGETVQPEMVEPDGFADFDSETDEAGDSSKPS